MKNLFGNLIKQKTIRLLMIFIFFLLSTPCISAQNHLISYLSKQTQLTKYTYQIKAIYPHDSRAFTQGLLYDDGYLYESTGLYGESSLKKVNLSNGHILQEVKLNDNYFAEGLTLFNNTLIQLTWKSHIVFLYDKDTFSCIGTFDYSYDGWGITHDKDNLIASDGSDTLRFIDPQNFTITREIQVHCGDLKIDQLNELEFIQDKIYANIWKTDLILIIHPVNGEVIGWIDLRGLEEQSDLSKKVLNGIAYDHTNDRLLVTGKFWPYLYEIRLQKGSLEK